MNQLHANAQAQATNQSVQPGRHRGRTLVAVSAIGLAVLLGACGKTDDGQTVGQKVDAGIANAEQKTEAAQAEAKQQMDAAKAQISEATSDAKQAVGQAADKVAEKLDDAAITASVNAELAKDPQLSALRINVDTVNGAVSLRGSAPNADARSRATTLASAVRGVTRVDNQLEVRG